MPIEFTQYPSPENTGVSGDTLFRLTVAYDGTGRRISKTRWVKAQGDAGWSRGHVTHYTGIGTEVRENFAEPAKETKVVVNMPVFFRVTLTRLKPRSYIEKDILRLSNGGAILPKQSFGASRQGLGRYGIEDADHVAENGSAQTFEWYLKNHLGSTMLVYGTGAGTPGGLKAAYDYRSFGEQIELTSPSTGKVTENFTGKEHDDEIALDYFGARYLDPMLGVWTSVDPARQFASPYLYAGNGMNPINVVDPDGNSDIVVLRPGTNDISNVIHIDDSFNLVGLVSDKSTEYYDAPPKDSYFYTENEKLIGQKFDPDMDQKARILIKDAYEQGPLAFYKWGEKGSLDFKNSAYSGADKTIGVLSRTIMTARDAGNAIWAGWTRYSYLNVINPIPERYSVKLNYVGMVILRDGYAIIQNALKREFKTEDPASAVMQKWGYYNYQP